MDKYKIAYKIGNINTEVSSHKIDGFKRIVRECELRNTPYQVYELNNRNWIPIRREFVISELLRK